MATLEIIVKPVSCFSTYNWNFGAKKYSYKLEKQV